MPTVQLPKTSFPALPTKYPCRLAPCHTALEHASLHRDSRCGTRNCEVGAAIRIRAQGRLGDPRQTDFRHIPAFVLPGAVVLRAGQARDFRIDAFDAEPGPQVDRAREYVADQPRASGRPGPGPNPGSLNSHSLNRQAP